MRSATLVHALASLGLVYGPGALAVDDGLPGNTQVSWKTSLSLGEGVRADNPDPRLLNPNNASLLGIDGATGGNTDDSDLNFRKGKPFTTLLNLMLEAGIKRNSFGGALGIRAWKDFTLEDDAVAHGSFNNRYQANTPLSDNGFESFARFSNVTLMNAYVYNNFDTAAGKLKVTVGRHVLSWGNENFIQGINLVNAIDFNALRAPGIHVKDARVPQGMISARLETDRGRSIEAFYQLQFQGNVFPGCGTYFLNVDASVGPNTQNACASGFVQARPGTGDAGGFASGMFIPASPTQLPGAGGQIGISGHLPLEALNTDIGLYAMNISSRTPILSAVKGNSPFQATTASLGAAGAQTSLFWEYPKNIQVFGASASTKLGEWAVGSEFSYVPDFPVQLASGDFIGATIYTADPAILSSLLQGQGVPVQAAPIIAGLMNANPGPLGSAFNGTPNGGVVHGYNSIRKTQFQFNAARGFTDIAGARLLTLATEAGFQWAGVPNDTDGVRYGRAFVFGVADSPTYNLGAYTGLPGLLGVVGNAVTQNGDCPLLNSPGQAGCRNQGFVTPFAWGFRVGAQLTYAAIFGTRITLKPTLFQAVDVSGYSADGQFNSGRRQTSVSVIAEIAKNWTAQVGYTTYNHSASWDPLRDRDHYSASVRVAF